MDEKRPKPQTLGQLQDKLEGRDRSDYIATEKEVEAHMRRYRHPQAGGGIRVIRKGAAE